MATQVIGGKTVEVASFNEVAGKDVVNLFGLEVLRLATQDNECFKTYGTVPVDALRKVVETDVVKATRLIDLPPNGWGRMDKIAMIKHYRERTGYSLAESKAFIEAVLLAGAKAEREKIRNQLASLT